MATTKQISSRRTFRVADPVDDDGDLTVIETVTDTAFHVVDYADPLLRDKLAARDVGSTVRLDLAPVDPAGLDWMVTRVLPGSPAVPFAELN
ncbi:hypothetical protein OB920_09010 [Halobacteria archaeon HArc-gm2]|nr:hypothetical protein [Halobacteria archaeon HArc-gm2]